MSKGGLGKTNHTEVPAGAWEGQRAAVESQDPRASLCCPGEVKSKNPTHYFYGAVTVGSLPMAPAPPRSPADSGVMGIQVYIFSHRIRIFT